MAAQNGGTRGDLMGAVLVFKAEYSLSANTVASAEPFVSDANKTSLATGVAGKTFAGFQDELRYLNNMFSLRREQARAEANAIALAERLKGRNDIQQLAVTYRRVLDLALEAQDYSTVRTVYFELEGLDIGYRASKQAFLSREGLGEFLRDLSQHCTLSVDEFQQKNLRIGECERTAVSIAGEIAREHLQSAHVAGEGEIGEDSGPVYALVDILTDVAPFIGRVGKDQGSDVSHLLGWTVAERETAVDAAIQRRAKGES